MPRRIPDYPDAFEPWNYYSSIGSMVSVVAIIVFIIMLYDCIVNTKIADNNPWYVPQYFLDYDNSTRTASTMEWSVPSPTPYHAFDAIPQNA